jgi:hypothetical protein
MKKSLIISWITAADYPLFRLWLKKWGVNFFDEIIIYFDVQFRYPFYWAFIEQDLAQFPEIKFIDPVPVEKDWRATATTELIKYATGDWICSIEQDWFTTNWGKLLADTQNAINSSDDMFGWLNPTNTPYIHPSYWFIKREVLEKTSKDFSAHPEINGSDHFAKITYDVNQLGGRITSLQDIGYDCDFKPDTDCFHLGGVNQNYLIGMNEGVQLHRPEAFLIYNYLCRQAQVSQDDKFLAISQDIEAKFLPQYDLNLVHNDWGKFFLI